MPTKIRGKLPGCFVLSAKRISTDDKHPSKKLGTLLDHNSGP